MKEKPSPFGSFRSRTAVLVRPPPPTRSVSFDRGWGADVDVAFLAFFRSWTAQLLPGLLSTRCVARARRRSASRGSGARHHARRTEGPRRSRIACISGDTRTCLASTWDAAPETEHFDVPSPHAPRTVSGRETRRGNAHRASSAAVRLRYSVICDTPASTAAWSWAHDATKHDPPRSPPPETHVKDDGAGGFVAVSEAASRLRLRLSTSHASSSGGARMAVASSKARAAQRSRGGASGGPEVRTESGRTTWDATRRSKGTFGFKSMTGGSSTVPQTLRRRCAVRFRGFGWARLSLRPCLRLVLDGLRGEPWITTGVDDGGGRADRAHRRLCAPACRRRRW